MLFYIVCGTLAILTIASVFHQINYTKGKLGSWDKLGILPNYSFFAPNPINKDFRLVYRFIGDTDETWKEVPVYNISFFYKSVWNPFKYYNKGIIDTCQQLLMDYHQVANKNHVQLSEGYIRILQMIAGHLHERHQNTKTIKFAIVSSVYEQGNLKLNNVEFASFQHLI